MMRWYCFFTIIFPCCMVFQLLSMRSDGLVSVRLNQPVQVQAAPQSSSISSYYQKAANAVKPVGTFLSRQVSRVSQAVQPGLDFVGRQATSLGSSVKSAYNAAPNVGLEIGVKKVGSVMQSGASKVSSAARAAYTKVVQSSLGYQATLAFSPAERKKVAGYEEQGINNLSFDLFGDHEGPGNLYTSQHKHEELRAQQALYQSLKKEGLSDKQIKSFVANKKNIRQETDKEQITIDKETQQIKNDLDTKLMTLTKNPESYRALQLEINDAMQIQDRVDQNKQFKNLWNQYKDLKLGDRVEVGQFL